MEPVAALSGKRVVLGVAGGTDTYRACTLVSHMIQVGAEIDVVMTEMATRFVTPRSFRSLTGRPVYADGYPAAGSAFSKHIASTGLLNAADLLLVAPAPAKTIARLAHGAHNEILTTLCLAVSCPVVIAPAVSPVDWEHPTTKADVATLRGQGVHFARLCADQRAPDRGRQDGMVNSEEIIGYVRWVLGYEGPLAQKRVVVTAGPTREPLDPVRFISNPSSGRQGFALAQAALDRGAKVTLVTGPTCLPTPVGAQRLDVTTAEEMKQSVIEACAQADLLLMAAAVADYRPATLAPEKIKRLMLCLHFACPGHPTYLTRSLPTVRRLASRVLWSVSLPRVKTC